MTLSYLASCYSRHPGGIAVANEQVCRAAATLIKLGRHIFSPVAHSHAIATMGCLDPLDSVLWMELDLKFIRACDELLILQLPGWDDSLGIKQEIKEFKSRNKPIKYLSWPDLEETPYD